MSYEQVIQKATEFAAKAHAGQKRKDGKDYITHPVAVLEILKSDIEGKTLETQINIGLSALLHDIAEDVDYYKENEELLISELFSHLGDLSNWVNAKRLITTLKVLNKNHHENYLEYILAVSKHVSASYVKKADLTHNMSDLKEGSLKDKYRLAYYLLERSTWQ